MIQHKIKTYIGYTTQNGCRAKPTARQNGNVRELKEYKENTLTMRELLTVRKEERKRLHKIVYLIRINNKRWSLGVIDNKKGTRDIAKEKAQQAKFVSTTLPKMQKQLAEAHCNCY